MHRLLGQAAETMQPQHLDQAEEFCRRALELDPACGAAYNVLANICSLRGDQAGMKRHLEKSIEVDGGSPIGRCNLALMYLDDGKVDEAEHLVKPLLDLRQLSQSELISYNVAMALIQLHRGNLEAVERALEFMLEMAPEDPMTQKLEQAMEKFKGMN